MLKPKKGYYEFRQDGECDIRQIRRGRYSARSSDRVGMGDYMKR